MFDKFQKYMIDKFQKYPVKTKKRKLSNGLKSSVTNMRQD